MPDSRTKLLRMLAEIDQQIREEAESLASDATLSDDDREFTAVQLDFRRRALESVETLLSKSEEEQEEQRSNKGVRTNTVRHAICAGATA
jgi:hypothetical protein